MKRSLKMGQSSVDGYLDAGSPPVVEAGNGVAYARDGSDPDAEADTGPRPRAKRNTSHCTVCRLYYLGHLKDRRSDDFKQARIRLAAGKKLQDDHSLAGLSSIPGSLIVAPRRGAYGPVDIGQMKIDAADRRMAALRAVGKSARFLLENVVLEDLTLTQTAQIMNVKDNAVLPALRVALDALAAHYSVGCTARSAVRGGVVQPLHPFQRFEV